MIRKKRWRGGILVLALLLVIFCGPGCIHLFYRLMTPKTVIPSNRLEYNILAGEESSLSPAAREASIRKRRELFLWFHARGLEIDEDDERKSIWHPWRELWEYWKL